jgi:hypothetical protein
VDDEHPPILAERSRSNPGASAVGRTASAQARVRASCGVGRGWRQASEVLEIEGSAGGLPRTVELFQDPDRIGGVTDESRNAAPDQRERPPRRDLRVT